MLVIFEEVGPTTNCSSRLLGEEDSKGNLTNELKNGQHFIIQSSLVYNLPTPLFIRKYREKLVEEALQF